MNLEEVDVLDFLEALGIRNINDGGDEIQFSCPFPGHAYGDETPSAYMNVETTAFYCHGCKAKGNAIHFLSKLEGISPLLAARHIRERYGSEFLDTDSFFYEIDSLLQEKPNDESLSLAPPSSMNLLESIQNCPAALNYLRERGFCDASIAAWEIGYDHISDRIAIPVRNDSGTLVGFKGRAYRSEHKPKYLVLGDTKRSRRYGFPTYEKSKVVFGMNKFIPDAHLFNHHLIITEGELDVVALWQSNYKNCVSVGSNFSADHREIILAHANSVTCFLDDDPAGSKAVQKIHEELSPYIQVKTVGPHEGDPASLTSEACAKLIREAQTLDCVWDKNDLVENV